MGSKNRRAHLQTVTSTAVAWTFYEADDFDCKRITLYFDAAPVAEENITVTLDSAQGAAYDTVLRTYDPVGQTSVSLENIDGLLVGDKLLVSYANTNTNAITGVAILEI